VGKKRIINFFRHPSAGGVMIIDDWGL